MVSFYLPFANNLEERPDRTEASGRSFTFHTFDEHISFLGDRLYLLIIALLPCLCPGLTSPLCDSISSRLVPKAARICGPSYTGLCCGFGFVLF